MFAYDDFMTFDTFYNKILQETTILEFPSQKYKQVNSSLFISYYQTRKRSLTYQVSLLIY